MYEFKAKDSEIKPYVLCLSNVSKDFTINNIKKNKIKSFSIVYDAIDTSNVLDTHRFLMKDM